MNDVCPQFQHKWPLSPVADWRYCADLEMLLMMLRASNNTGTPRWVTLTIGLISVKQDLLELRGGQGSIRVVSIRILYSRRVNPPSSDPLPRPNNKVRDVQLRLYT